MKKLTTLAGSQGSPCWLEHMSCRGRIPQFGLRRREYRNLRYTRLASRTELDTTQTSLSLNDLTLQLRKFHPSLPESYDWASSREIKNIKSDRFNRFDSKTGCHKDGYDDITQNNGSSKTMTKTARDDQVLMTRLDAYIFILLPPRLHEI